MIILGIDPAIRTTGYGVIRIENGKTEVLDCGVIENSPRLPHSECVRRLAGGIRELIGSFHPDWAVLEDPFLGRNAKTAIILGMARGAILSAIAEQRIPCCAYSPKSAKRAAVGNGSAEKGQVAVMIAAMFNIGIDRIPLDATDALALALCHAQILAGGPELAAAKIRTL